MNDVFSSKAIAARLMSGPIRSFYHYLNSFKPTAKHATNPFRSIRPWRQFLRGRAPIQIVIQFTDRCNASCAQCGMRRENDFPRSVIPVDSVKRMLDAMAEQGAEAVSFTGGEPLLYLKQVTECMRHARSLGIKYIRTGTNGFLFRGHKKPGFTKKIHHIAESLARSELYTFWISLDSALPEVHEQNRGLPGTVAGIEKALSIFHEYNLYPSANLGINRYLGGFAKSPIIDNIDNDADKNAFYAHYQQGFRAFYKTVDNMGFTIVNACYPMSLDHQEENAIYTATSSDESVQFSKHEKLQLFKALYDTIPEFRHRLRIFTPRSSLHALIRQHQGATHASYPCRGGIDFFFIDASDMNTYPCGFRGQENLGKLWDLDVGNIDKNAWCRQCDWECFRDPSEIAGPVLDLFQQPIQLTKRFLQDRSHLAVWYEDMDYYKVCNYFNGMTPPNYNKLERFKPISA